MSMPNPIAALVAMLLADTGDLDALVGERVYGYELDIDETDNQARAAVVIQPAPGGASPQGCMRLGVTNVDIFCYGADPLNADTVRLAVLEILKFTLRVVFAETLIHSMTPRTTPMYMRDKNTNWPLVMQSYSIMASETVVT